MNVAQDAGHAGCFRAILKHECLNCSGRDCFPKMSTLKLDDYLYKLVDIVTAT